MKNLDLIKTDEIQVQELNAKELQRLEGGLIWFAAIPLVKVAAAGFTAGVAIGGIVLNKILSDKDCTCE